jgi:DNA-binding NtrC family response regulator
VNRSFLPGARAISPPYVNVPTAKQILNENFLENAINRHIEAMLLECLGNRSRAARELCVSWCDLIRKIEKCSLRG